MNSTQIYKERSKQCALTANELVAAVIAISRAWTNTQGLFSGGPQLFKNNGLNEAAHLTLILMELYGFLADKGQVSDMKDYGPLRVDRPKVSVTDSVNAIVASVRGYGLVPIEDVTAIISKFISLYGWRTLVDLMYTYLGNRPTLQIRANEIL